MTSPGAGTERAGRWLLLIHRIPTRPHYLRVAVGRRVRSLGAVPLKNSVYVALPSPEARRELTRVAAEIQQRGGEAAVCEASFVAGLENGAIEDRFRAASDAEYAVIAREAKRIASAGSRTGGAGARRGRASIDARDRSAMRALERLRERFAATVKRDAFRARSRESTGSLLSLIEDRLQGVEEAGAASSPPTAPRGARWVTRRGVMVDRIASAWLIRRFIDSEARFRFVPPRGFKPGRGEIRFDMAGAEYTHEGARCTFETLLHRFQLRDSALAAIGEIVHDLDLEDASFNRPEAAGVGRLIVGLAITEPEDEARLARGAVLFDDLYESFRSRRPGVR